MVAGTHLAKAIAPKLQMIGVCYHHQNIVYPVAESATGYKLKPNSFDAEDGTVHGLDLDDSERMVFSVLWHPESCKSYSDDEVDKEENFKIVQYLRDKAAEYRKQRLSKSKS